MKQSEVNKLSTLELSEKLTEIKTSYANLKRMHTISPLENPLQLRHLRRTVARLATELTKRDGQ